MQRKIFYNGVNIKHDELVIGNHSPVQIIVNGGFDINGLIYCPKYHVEILVNGNGRISLHGICKTIVLKRVAGSCVFDLQELVVNEIIPGNLLKGCVTLKVSKSKIVNENFLGENVVILREPSLRSKTVETR